MTDASESSQSRTDEQAPSGPLSGLRVIEMGQLVAGPFCGQLLGDLGADVIKLEDPGKGDPMRQWGQTLPQGQSMWWAVVGRNKRSTTLNLREAAGQELARRLISTADVLVENFRPGTMERWGLGYAALAEQNPRLIMTRISGYGQDGPYSTRAGYGAIGEAMGGLRYVVGDPSTPPSRMGISIGDALAAMFATVGTLAALHERETSGRGQIVDSAIYEAVLGMMESLVPEWQINGYQRERSGAILPKISPSNVYPTKDGQWILIAANQDTVFTRLAELIGMPELAADERYSSHIARGDHQGELDDIIAQYTSTQPAEQLEAALVRHSVPAGRIFRPVDMIADPQFQARKSIIEVPHPLLGALAMQNVFPRLSRTAGVVRWPGEPLGHHTDEVMGEIGVDKAEVDKLRSKGIV